MGDGGEKGRGRLSYLRYSAEGTWGLRGSWVWVSNQNNDWLRSAVMTLCRGHAHRHYAQTSDKSSAAKSLVGVQ